jgi:hypothetical protein
MTAREKQINLLPKDKWEKGVVGKLLKWGLHVGRYVVIFTELIVILSFLYRFSLDRKLTDLNEEMKQKQRIVESYEDFEVQFRRLQEQLKMVKEVESSSVAAGEILNSISLMTPIDTSYKSISIRGEEVSLEGQTLSDVGLATLLTKAQNDDKFSEVVLESVSSATDKSQAIEFRMNLTLAQVNQVVDKK